MVAKERVEKIGRSSLFDPRCCTYKLDGKIRSHVESLIESNAVDSATKSILVNLMDIDEANKSTLTYDSLVKLHKYIQRADPNYTEPFYQFSGKCKCIEPKPRANKQLEDRLNLLRLRTSQAMYDSMTASVDRAVEKKIEKLADIGNEGNVSTTVYSSNINDNNDVNSQTQMSEYKKLNGSLVAVFNSFLVFICTFIFCYKALEYSLSRPNIAAQVLFGLGGSTVVAIAELYFLIRVV